KDQVDALTASGVAATFLNSSLRADESRARLRGLHQGEYRLLYVAPERMMLSGFLSDLQRWKVNLIAIDEAHCISEWGHDFRPEYRQLAELRKRFPETPVMALTATATKRVQSDIVKQLRLRTPGRYIASFDRPNLTYHVLPKNNSYRQLLEFAKTRPGDSGIVYCQSRRSAESLAERLNEDGIEAKPYHAGLDAKTRATNQELFLRDEVRVICATIAFGMGINKPNVRFVVHYDMPKNVEGYYQETGRAGRDGLPSECLLLFSAGDAVKYSKFIDEVSDEQERKIARQQLRRMVELAEGAECRRVALLRYFGEEFREPSCGACDNCMTPRETYDGTVEAQKFLSCVYRVREKSGFDFGVNQIAEVLTGAETEKILKWDHQTVSTYGIGKEHSQAEWKLIGRELVRLGYLSQLAERFNVLQVTDEGWRALKQRQPIRLVKPIAPPKPEKFRAEKHRVEKVRARSHRAGEIDCDEALFDRLRRLRKRLADERGVPPYIVFSDVSLRQMARYYPSNESEFARINGVGERKLTEFGRSFITEIEAHLRKNPRRAFDG
ncbi:MAG TPA: RecQ family ATP-dependent DNA helicase, partial [Pyrinomonadaceae bacterium]|nr:RecQ family ATP-dependent DNA helicase [Pyrinomonadaceae bacterium]